MSIPKRIGNVVLALIMIIGAVIILLVPEIGYPVAMGYISIYLIVKGIVLFVYYFSMARHMVGGRNELFKGLIYLDCGLYLFFSVAVPQQFVLSFILIVIGIDAVIHLIRAVQLKKAGASLWKPKIIMAAIGICAIIVANVFTGSPEVFGWIYALWIFSEAAEKLYYSFRKTKLFYFAKNETGAV